MALEERVSDPVTCVTAANKITFSRVLLIPAFCGAIFFFSNEREWLRWLALGTYVVAGASDLVDGYIARQFNQRSQLGVRLDPLADKLINNLGYIFVAANTAFEPAIPQWLPVVILVRDVIIVMGAFLVNEYVGKLQVHPSIPGKLTTFCQMTTLFSALAGLGITTWLIPITLVVSLISMVEYVYDGTMQALRKEAA